MIAASQPYPALAQQQTFRVLLRAMSQPGECCSLLSAGDQKHPLLRIVLETLIDHEVAFAWIGPSENDLTPETVTRWTHARSVDLSEADFGIVIGDSSGGKVLKLKRGSAEMPDTGATMIYRLPRSGHPESFLAEAVCSGPGIGPETCRQVAIPGLNPEELLAIREANEAFPLGIDCIFLTADGNVIALPRSTQILEVSPWPM